MGEHGNIIDRSNDWYTPAWVFEKIGERFDLDVAAPKEGPRYVPADVWFYERGLEQPWSGFVWMNPPFGHMQTKFDWLRRFLDHRNGIALMPDRTSAPWWQWVAPQMDALLFVTPKIKFERPDGSLGEQPGTGTVLMAMGERGVEAIRRASHNGLGVMFASAKPAKGETSAALYGADLVMAEVEKRFPDWKNFRDIIDCIDVTLDRLRKGAIR